MTPSRPQVETLPGMELEAASVDTGDGPALTAEQEQAVSRRAEPLIVSAAAGSGKTSVLVERFVRAVREDGIAPGRILAITFTERAAGELRARVRGRLLELGDRQAARDTEAAFVGTFHGFCARVLRSHSVAAGLDPAFEIVDEGLAGRLRELAFTAAVREFLAGERTEAVDLLAAYGVDRVRSMIEQVYLQLRSTGQRHPRLPEPAVEEPAEALALDAARACALLEQLLEGFGRAYAELKQGRGAVDFDDLELITLELLAGGTGIRAAWSDRFELLMVDEFQDTNPRQLGILRALERGNLFTVGDEFQSIYGFRHADVSLFRSRRAELRERGASLTLTHNFRSREPLLDAVNVVFAGRFTGYEPLLAARAADERPGLADPRAPVAPGDAGEPAVELLLTDMDGWEEHALAGEIAAGLPHSQLWRQAEARLLAQRVGALIEAGEARAGDVAVLLRASGDLEVYERALQLRGLRTLAAVGAFWGHQQIGDLVSYLRALANPRDEEALYGALASPLGGCSRDGLALLAEAARQGGRRVWDTALAAVSGEGELLTRLAAGDRDRLLAFCALLERERDAASGRTLSDLIERAIEATGYREHVLGLDWGERRLANVHKLLRLARRFEASEGRDLRGFLDHVEYLKGAVKVEPDAPVDGVEPDAVRLMTVHAAKGLEFPVVCLADLGRQPNTMTPDLLVAGDRLGLRLMRLDGEGSTPALEYEELCVERRQREAGEEDRILYVAMTRARDRLLLSGAVGFERWAASRQAPTPISWLATALAEDLPILIQQGQPPISDLRVGRTGAAGSVGVRCLLNSPATVGTVLLHPGTGAAPAESVPPPAPRTAPGAIASDAQAQPVEQPASRSERGEEGRISTLSYTSLSELERCGYRYYLERVIGLAEDRAPAREEAHGLEARARGTLVHRLMESLDFARPSPPSAEDVAGAGRELGMRVDEGERVEISRLIETASTAALATRLAAARTVRREHPFAFSPGAKEPLVTGVIDLMAAEPDGGYVVVDYKSDRLAPGVRLGDLVERDYAVQRLLYALAVLREGALSVEVVHWFLERPEEWASARYTAADRPALEDQLAERLTRARERPFAVSPRPHRGLCLTCPGRAGLCSWGETETMREVPELSGAAAEGS